MPGNASANKHSGAPTSEQQPKKRRRGGRRGKTAQTLGRINATAIQRQQAWGEGGRPNLTQQLTTELNGPEHLRRPEGLFAEGRQQQAGEMEPGSPTTSRMYRG